jgi:hypothetical protein
LTGLAGQAWAKALPAFKARRAAAISRPRREEMTRMIFCLRRPVIGHSKAWPGLHPKEALINHKDGKITEVIRFEYPLAPRPEAFNTDHET